MHCPYCNSSNFQTVSVIYNTQMRINNKGYDGSLLAYELEPPQLRKYRLLVALIVMLGFVALLINIAINKVPFLLQFSLIGNISIVLIILSIIACFFKIYANFVYNNNKYHQEYGDWAKQWYCLCCGSKFVANLSTRPLSFIPIESD